METELAFGKHHIGTSINVLSGERPAKFFPITHEALGSTPVLCKLNMVVDSCRLSPQMVKTGGSEIVGHSCQHNEFKGSLGYMTPCLRYMSKRIKRVVRVNMMKSICAPGWRTWTTSSSFIGCKVKNRASAEKRAGKRHRHQVIRVDIPRNDINSHHVPLNLCSEKGMVIFLPETCNLNLILREHRINPSGSLFCELQTGQDPLFELSQGN